jgi:hypothetical protein
LKLYFQIGSGSFKDMSSQPKLFVIHDGAVSGNTSQDDANAFAADYQGLRHFSNRVGEALNLGTGWLGAFREADFSHLWVVPGADTDLAKGVMLERRAILSEMLEVATTREA